MSHRTYVWYVWLRQARAFPNCDAKRFGSEKRRLEAGTWKAEPEKRGQFHEANDFEGTLKLYLWRSTENWGVQPQKMGDELYSWTTPVFSYHPKINLYQVAIKEMGPIDTQPTRRVCGLYILPCRTVLAVAMIVGIGRHRKAQTNRDGIGYECSLSQLGINVRYVL